MASSMLLTTRRFTVGNFSFHLLLSMPALLCTYSFTCAVLAPNGVAKISLERQTKRKATDVSAKQPNNTLGTTAASPSRVTPPHPPITTTSQGILYARFVPSLGSTPPVIHDLTEVDSLAKVYGTYGAQIKETDNEIGHSSIIGRYLPMSIYLWTLPLP